MKKRWFVVAPQYDGDFLWKVCSTTSRDSFLNVYLADAYKEEKDFDNEIDALRYSTKKNNRKAKVI